MDKSLEQQANELLMEDAKRRGTTLYREGILDERRQATIKSREISMSHWLSHRERK